MNRDKQVQEGIKNQLIEKKITPQEYINKQRKRTRIYKQQLFHLLYKK